MKHIDSSSLALGAGTTSLQLGAFAELSPAAYGKAMLEQAGLSTLEAIKDTFVSDPGASVVVDTVDGGTGFTVSGGAQGWLVVESCADDHRGIVFQTAAGATAQVWSILAMQDAGTVSLSESTTTSTPILVFQGMGPLGMKSVVMANLQAE
jgi:hypothetical protein